MPHMFPALIARGISQTASSQGGRTLLEGIDLTVHPGRIHAIVGQSGAGKTVLAEILAGAVRPAGGTIHLQGQLTSLKSEADAASKAVRYVRQAMDYQSKVSVAEALQLDAIPRKFGMIDTHVLLDRARGQLSMAGMSDVDPKCKVCELRPGQQKLLQVATALAKSASLLILDDPAASLKEAETHVLYQRLSQLQYGNTGILYFTSSAEEALQVGDDVSVLRDGRLIVTHDPTTVFTPQIEGEMIGRDTSHDPLRPPRNPYPEVGIRVEGLSIEHRVYGLSMKVRRGEVFGLLGLQGAGQSETARAIGGLVPRTEGEVFLRASAQQSRIRTKEEAVACGVGLIADPYGIEPEVAGGELPNRSSRPLKSLGASNPQRQPIANCLRSDCSVLVFDNPTRGLNVACRLEVQRAIPEIADIGVSVIVASTNVDELVAVCDRIAVMVDGRIVRTVDRSNFSAEKLRAVLKGGK